MDLLIVLEPAGEENGGCTLRVGQGGDDVGDIDTRVKDAKASCARRKVARYKVSLGMRINENDRGTLKGALAERGVGPMGKTG
jgi:hypothetical protein